MPNDFTRDIKNFVRRSDALSRLMVVNVGFYILYGIPRTVVLLFNLDTTIPQDVISWLAVPSGLDVLLYKPWTLLTYMFVHQEFFHIFFNMLWLYWMGSLFLEYLGSRKLATTYMLGGLAGAVLYIAAFNVFPGFKELPSIPAIGASAGVMAVIIGISTLIPNHQINLMFVGPVSLKYVAIGYIVLDFIGISENNAGGHVTHLGGALYGFIYVRQLKKGRDFSSGISSFFSSLASIFERKKMKVYYNSGNQRKVRPLSDDQYALQKKEKQEIIDGILDKISQSGYDSLTRKEKEILFRMSRDESS
jgi:membrane associated rhomboid family serine protease